MNKYLIAGLFCLSISSLNCASLMRAFVPDSPRPNSQQLSTAKEVSETNVTTIAGLQSNKQEKMAQVAEAALKIVSESKIPEQVEAASNIAANAFKAIERADGTRNTLGKLQGTTMEDILKMTTAQYLAGIAAQTAVDVGNKESLYSGINTGWQWTKTNIGGLAGIASLLLGGGFGAKVLRSRVSTAQAVSSSALNDLSDAQDRSIDLSSLLQGQAQATEQWKKEHPEHKSAWDSLKSYLMAVHSATPLDVPKELGLS